MADDLVDLWDVTVGSWPEDSGTSRYYPEGHQRRWTSRMREATAKPIVAVGRYTSPDLMAQVVGSGEADLIGSARQAIADPFLPRKIAEGRLDEIRECTGSNICILREETFNQIGCVQNATAGEEFRRGWHPELFPPAAGADRPVLVVGAGPAGMECAVVLAKRGFSAIHLVEAEAEIGGRLRWTRRLPTLGDWGRITDWRAVQLAKLPGVEVITGRRLRAADVLEYGAEMVVIATGSSWRGDGTQPGYPGPMPGAGPSLPHVLTPGAGRARASGRPAGGWWSTTPTATTSGRASPSCWPPTGYEVTVVTTFAVLSPVSDQTLEGEMLRAHLHRAGVRVVHADHDHRDQAGRWTCGAAVDGGGPRPPRRSWSAGCDGVVLVTQQASTTRCTGAGRRPGGPGAPPGSPRCTGSATRSRPGCCRRRSSTGTGSPARSTRPTRRRRCPTAASAPNWAKDKHDEALTKGRPPRPDAA